MACMPDARLQCVQNCTGRYILNAPPQLPSLATEPSLWPGQSCVYRQQFVTLTVYTLSSADSNRTFLICVLMIDFVMPFRSGLAHGGHKTATYYYYYYYYYYHYLYSISYIGSWSRVGYVTNYAAWCRKEKDVIITEIDEMINEHFWDDISQKLLQVFKQPHCLLQHFSRWRVTKTLSLKFVRKICSFKNKTCLHEEDEIAVRQTCPTSRRRCRTFPGWILQWSRRASEPGDSRSCSRATAQMNPL